MPYRSHPAEFRDDSGHFVVTRHTHPAQHPAAPRLNAPQGQAGHHAGHPGHPHHGTAHHPQQAQRLPAAPARQPERRAAAAAAAAYVLTHAGRQLRFGPLAFWTVVGTLVVMAGWSVLTGTYFAFHDDVITRMIARQAQMQFAYEDRIADLRAQIDRISSRQLLDQEQFEQKLDTLVRRQTTLEQRAATIGSAVDPTTTGSIRPSGRGEPQNPKPSPINDTVIFSAPPDREARLESRNPGFANTRPASPTRGVAGALARLSDSLDRVEQLQTASMNVMEETYDSRARRIRGVLVDLGLDAGKPPEGKELKDAKVASAMGGPFIPAGKLAGNFEKQAQRIALAKTYAEKLQRQLAAVPVRKPVVGPIDMSSPFGMRMDPFVRGPAIHSGVDMRGDPGDPARATATGTVTTAGWNGGYGKMVEIDHGNGLTTRYGHLSEIKVTLGQSVKINQVIGLIGSTGRSTGPHLHYETRVDGDAVDPQKFLRAGVRLGNLL